MALTTNMLALNKIYFMKGRGYINVWMKLQGAGCPHPKLRLHMESQMVPQRATNGVTNEVTDGSPSGCQGLAGCVLCDVLIV